mgnify:CR=1 FL=1
MQTMDEMTVPDQSIVGDHPSICKLRTLVNRVAQSPARTVLILDAMAATLHSLSDAADLFGMIRHALRPLRHQMKKLTIV